jgi:2-succinyl-6-hydroxy-2,4-cyclohexadiene-1-carboxylate synthase
VPDLAGHGARPTSASSFAGEVERLLTWSRANGFERGVIAGYSLGGRLALGAALTAPELFSHVLLVSAHPGLVDSQQRMQRAADDDALAARLLLQGLRAFVDDWERLPLFASQMRLPADLLEAQRSLRLQHSEAAVASALMQLSLGRMPDFNPQLPGLRLPVRLLVGALDTKFVALAEDMQRALPDSSIEVIPGSGHNLLIECPAAVAAAIRKCL